jgi:hypothetical protein
MLSVDYKNRNKQHDAWQDISEALNIERIEVENIKSLTAQFYRELKKETQKPPGS